VNDRARSHRRLAALAACASEKNVTQRALAARLGVSLGLANGLLRRLEEEGCIVVTRASGTRSSRYAVTARGRREMRRLNAALAEEAGCLLERPRRALEERVRTLSRPGRRRALLCGEGPLADVAASALLNGGMKLAAVVAVEPKGGRVWGVAVRPLSAGARVACDLAVGVTPRDAAALRRLLRGKTPVTAFLQHGTEGHIIRA